MKRAAAVLVLAALAAGCGKKGGPATEAVLIFGRGGDSVRLDPGDITDGESVKVCNQIFETLTTYADESPAIVPCLAESWESSEGGKVWTFRLRKGVKFHDGTPFDAEAVVFSLKRQMEPENPHRFGGAFAYSSNYAEIETVAAKDPATAVFTLKAPSAVFLTNMSMFPASIVNPAAVKARGKEFALDPAGAGTGPFRFVSWKKDEKIVLEANPDYWGGKPALDRVIFKPVPENAARLEQLRRGEIHVMDNFSFSDVDVMRKDAALRVDVITGMNFGYLAMNCDRPPFDNPKVRRAVAHAVNKAKVLELAVFGFGATGPNPMPPSVPGYHDGIQDFAFDPEKAKALLREAGHPDGFETDFWAMTLVRPYMPRPMEVAEILKEDLKAVGIRARIVTQPWDAYLEKVQNGEHPMCLLGWTADNGDPDNFLWQLLAKENAVKGSAQNVAFYRNDEVSALLDRAKHVVDEKERLALYRKAQELIHEDCPMIPLLYLPQMIAYRKEVKGYPLHPLGIVKLGKVKIENQ